MLPPFDPWRTWFATTEVGIAGAMTRDALQALQARRLAQLLHAARRSSLYRHIIGERDPSAIGLTDLPVMTKSQLMARFGEWVTDPRLTLDALRAFLADPANIGAPFEGRYLAWESSGSHGEPGIFVQDAAALAVYDALEFLRRRIPRPLQHAMDPWGWAQQMVFVGATNGHFASTLSVERLRRLSPLLASHLHSVSFLEAPAVLAARLEAIAPAVLATYPSVAVMLAEAHIAGRLDISPKEIWTGGETLTPAMRKLVSEAFGCIVVNSYGASEFMSLASECARGALHLNSDWAILEPVDDAGMPVPAGELGATTLLTNLANHVQPIIRYDLGDRVRIHPEPCTCGSPLPVISVEGRSGDLMRLDRPGQGQVGISLLALSTVLESVQGLTDFQLQQCSPCALRLSTELEGEPAHSALRRAKAALRSFLASQGADAIEVRCQEGHPSRRTRSGKVERVIALPPQPQASRPGASSPVSASAAHSRGS